MPLDLIILARIVTLLEDDGVLTESIIIMGMSLCNIQRVFQRYQDQDAGEIEPKK